ncbi:MAG: hypothetical protein Q9183_007781, partial [Haloplaca sp. 2 TL-2023]
MPTRLQVPYFAKALISNRNILNINLKAIALGNPTLGNNAAMTSVVINSYLHQKNVNDTYKIPQNLLDAFDDADQQCGFDKVMSQIKYPPAGKILIPGNPEGANFRMLQKRQIQCFDQSPNTPALINASVNAPCSLGCATFATAINYLSSERKCFSPYNIENTCESDALDFSAGEAWFNHPDVKKAIHAPEKKFQGCNGTVFMILSEEYVTPPAYEIVPELLEKGLKVHIYSGGLDLLLNHLGTELVVQNMTWNGKQGFQHPPDRIYTLDGKPVANWNFE